MKALFDTVSADCSRIITRSYSTSFSAGIYFLNKRLHRPLYSIYAFVRSADEIVDSFEGYDKRRLLEEFREQTYRSLEDRISLNPVLNSFQQTVHEYGIRRELIDTFLKSMEMDLERRDYDRRDFDEYILGSAEVVGLMCLHVFTEGDQQLYERLKAPAMKLGAAFQKVNFLRDMQADYHLLGRMYFPHLNFDSFNEDDKAKIESEISSDFREAYEGIRQLPASSRLGVYIAYRYYQALLNKIRRLSARRVKEERIRVRNDKKLRLMVHSYIEHRLNLL
jgi:phytoene/squalene synthetase